MGANKDNLVGHGFDEITAEEQRKIASAGGKASVEARRKKKALREYLEILMEKPVAKDPNDGHAINGAEGMAVKAMQAALQGDWEAWRLVRDTAGQKPVDVVVTAEVEQDVIDEVEQMVNDGQKDGG